MVSRLVPCTGLAEISEKEEEKGAFKLAMTECKEMVGFGERLDKGRGRERRGNCWHTPWRDRGSFSLLFFLDKRIFSI